MKTVRKGRRDRPGVGAGELLIGAALGLVSNLLTNTVNVWPGPLRPWASRAWLLTLVLVVGVGARIVWLWWRRRIPRPMWPGGNPYPGLAAYDEDRAGVFFGRRAEIRDLVDRVRESRLPHLRFVPVVGPSGSGKSSLVGAGLIPTLTGRADWLVLPAFTPGSSALTELGHVLNADVSGLVQEPDSETQLSTVASLLLEALSRRRIGRRVVLIVDQLEECVTQQHQLQRDVFMALLGLLLEREERLRVVVTLRSEWIGHFQGGMRSDLFREPFMVNVLTADGVREVITGPSRVTDTGFEPGLSEEIVAEAGRGDALPLVSYLLHDLYELVGNGGTITRAGYVAAGGVGGAITRRAEAAVAALGRDSTPDILDTLLLFVMWNGAEPTRQRVPAEGLTERQRAVIEEFIDVRLLTSDSRDGVNSYDLAHEALLRQWPALREHIDARREELLYVSGLAHAARAWDQSGRRPDFLLTGTRLAEAIGRTAPGAGIAAPVAQFVDASRQQETSELAVRADFAARQADSEDDPELALAIAYAACTELAATPAAASALRSALDRGLRHVLNRDDDRPGEGWPGMLAFGPDGDLASSSADGHVRIWAADSTLRHVLQSPTSRRRSQSWAWEAVAYLPDGRLAVYADATEPDAEIRIWSADAQSCEVIRAAGPITATAFAPDGRIAIGCDDGTVEIRDGHGGLLATLTSHTKPIRSLAFASDGRLAVDSADGILRVWDPDGTLLHAEETQTAWVYWPVVFAPDGRLAASAPDGGVRIWTADWTLAYAGAGASLGTGPVSLAFAADGRFAIGDANRLSEIMSASGRQLHQLDSHHEAVVNVAFAPDGRLATWVADQTGVTMWGLDGKRLHDIAGPDSGRAYGTSAVAFAADGRIATTAWDGVTRIWDFRPQPEGRTSAELIAVAARCSIRRLALSERQTSTLPYSI